MNDNVFLSYFLNEQLYHIAELPAETSERLNSEVFTSKEPVEVSLKSSKDILILFENEQDSDLPQEDLNYLEKILGAVHLKLEDVDFINLSINKHPEIIQNKVVVFTENYSLPEKQLYEIKDHGQSSFLPCHDLGTISSSIEYRKLLWNGLQQMFK